MITIVGVVLCGDCRKWTTEDCPVVWKDGEYEVANGDHDDFCPYGEEHV